MIISRRHKFVFLRTRHTDCARVEVALSPLCGPRDMLRPLETSYELLRRDLGVVPRHYARWPFAMLTGAPLNLHGTARRPTRGFDVWGLRRFPAYPSAADVAHVIGEPQWSQMLSFAVERDPLERVAEAFDDARAAGRCDHVGDFLARNLPPPNATIYGDGPDLAVDCLIRFDHLDEDLSTVCERLGVNHRGWLPRSTRAERAHHRPWWALFSDAEVDHIVHHYRDDYRLMHDVGIALPEAVISIMDRLDDASGYGSEPSLEPV